MKLRHIVIASAVSCSLGSLAWAQQSQEGAQGQAQPQQQQDQSMRQGQAMEQGGQHAQNPEVVRQVQKSLNEQGYDAGPIDGKWGPKTQSALKNFQQAKGLEASGQLDEETLAELDVEAEAATGAAGAGSQPGSGAGGAAGQQESQRQPGGQSGESGSK